MWTWQLKLSVNLLLAEISDQCPIADLINQHATIKDTDDHLFLVEEEKGLWCLEIGNRAAFLRDDIVDAKRVVQWLYQKVLIELLKEFHTG